MRSNSCKEYTYRKLVFLDIYCNNPILFKIWLPNSLIDKSLWLFLFCHILMQSIMLPIDPYKDFWTTACTPPIDVLCCPQVSLNSSHKKKMFPVYGFQFLKVHIMTVKKSYEPKFSNFGILRYCNLKKESIFSIFLRNFGT